MGEDASRSRRTAGATDRARKLRRNDNMAEAVLWNELKDRKLGGRKFVRQFPIGPYFADFVCRGKRLVVELDGSQHTDSSYDRRRDAYMAERGWAVLRFGSWDVLKHNAGVCETILAALDGRLDATVAPDLRYVPACAGDNA